MPAEMISIYVYSMGIDSDMLDELGHANYNKLKEFFEGARMEFCTYLGFSRRTLRRNLQIGLYMIEDNYKYHKSLKEGDVIFCRPSITFDSPVRITIKLSVFRWTKELTTELTNEVEYKMAMVNLQTERPCKIPKGIVKSAERFELLHSVLMQILPRVVRNPARLPS